VKEGLGDGEIGCLPLGFYMNIILIGYRGSGKSTVGSKLAARLKMRFVDTDDLIEERQGVPINDIVKSHGWVHFRKLEKSIIEEISKGNNLIIAPGGGAVLGADNVKSLRRNGLIIWLKADRQTLLKRMNQDPGTNARRPTLTGKGTLEELEEVISTREPFYERASEIQIDASKMDVDAVVESILTVLKEKGGRV
jgi:shikimate kinase